MILDNLAIKKEQKYLIVPRHPERFDEVDRELKSFCQKYKLSYHRFSQKEDFESDMILIDCMGELINLYAISDIVILAGSFVDGIGGHNPLEPAHFGCKIVSGKYIFNQEALYSLVDGIEVMEIENINNILPQISNTKITSSVDIEPIINTLN